MCMCVYVFYRISDLLMSDVFWVLTVPAAWSDWSKPFMRVAAIKV